MNWLKKGPELNLSSLRSGDLKLPPFLVDLYYDLRDRRLLLPLALVVVAIVAVPFLLKGGSDGEDGQAPPKAAVAVAGASSAPDSSKLAVVESKPGLRDYHKRLAAEKPTNPFKQRYTTPVLDGAELNPQTESSSTTVTTTETSSTPEAPSGGAPPSGPAPHGTGGKPKLVLFSWAIDVRISKSQAKGSAADTSQEATDASQAATNPATPRSREPEQPSATKSQEPSVRHEVLPLTKLPGDKAPVVTFMGPSKKGNPLFLVSGKVKSVFGEAKCVSGDDVCQLLEVAPTFPVVFVYGENEVHYTINVLKMELVVTGHKPLPRSAQNFSK
jgi:hypothetical protein